MNSITFPAAILGRPFYDPLWPASVNYGAFGVVAGHELTHGFDDEGVQWDGVGKLNQWMSNSSLTGFKVSADGCETNLFETSLNFYCIVAFSFSSIHRNKTSTVEVLQATVLWVERKAQNRPKL